MIGIMVSAQSLERQVIGASGTAVSNSGQGLSYTVGELVTQYGAQSNAIVSQGFQQAEQEDFADVLDLNIVDLVAAVFPNPTSHSLELRSNLFEQGITQLSYTIYSVQGQEIAHGTVESNGGVIPVESLAAAPYNLILTDDRSGYRQAVRFVKI